MVNEGQPFRVRMPRGKEVLGVIEAMLGVNKIRVRCQDNKVRIVRIPGRLRKSMWMKENDVVLVEPWSIQGDKSGDVIWKYSPTEASWLRRRGILKI